jgi:hypothetical protein
MHDQPHSDHELLSLKVPVISFSNFNKFYDYKTGLPHNKPNLSLLYFFINVLKKRSEMLKIKKISLKAEARQYKKKEYSSAKNHLRNEKQGKRAVKKFFFYF